MRAHDYFARARTAAAAIDVCRRELDGLLEAQDQCTSWEPSGSHGAHGSGMHSDPTATAAQKRMESLSRAIVAKRNELDAHVDTVGECLGVIALLRHTLSPRHGDALELYYVDRADTWSEVADELGCSVRTVWTVRDEAYKWCDDHVLMA